ncbi:MAG TPA: (Fe-S)-binding protein [Spirochaetia bacterium]|nr:(Fe-S)-binding protein [Spirochaetia bacterium]
MGIQEIRQTTESCKHCFMCRHACPTFLATKLDSHTPRGYALLLSEIDHGYQSWTPAIIDRFYQCSRCGLCREDCAYHWAEDEVVRNAREEIVAGGLAPARVKNVADSIVAHHHPYGEAPDAWTPPSAIAGKKKAEILYFAGCATRKSHPEIALAIEKIMGVLGADWTVMGDEECCGAPLFDLGFTEKARETSRRLVGKLKETRARLLLTGCPHCHRAFTELYPSWGSPLPEGLQVMHVSQYLLDQLRHGNLNVAVKAKLGKASYHDPCQLGRKAGEYNAPRALITLAIGNPPRELFHTREKAECCGAGSSMFLTDPQIASQVADKRIQAVREADSDVVITACQNCKQAFMDAQRAKGPPVRVLDVSELMAMVV